jgi:serine/threonine-protein kinase ATR
MNLCNYHITGADTVLSMSKDFRLLYRAAPSRMIIPLQNSMTVRLPAGNNQNEFASHRPFPVNLPTITSKPSFVR